METQADLIRPTGLVDKIAHSFGLQVFDSAPSFRKKIKNQ
jgi:hypothetical protein